MMLLAWFIRPITLRTLLFMMGTISPRSYAEAPKSAPVLLSPAPTAGSPWIRDQLIAQLGGACPTPTVGLDNGFRCQVGTEGCFDDAKGQEIVKSLQKGCEEGKGGEGAPCLYGIFIRSNGQVTAVCGPRMLDARK